jgi:hypothetical protein
VQEKTGLQKIIALLHERGTLRLLLHKFTTINILHKIMEALEDYQQTPFFKQYRIIIISAERGALLDIGLPQSSPRRSVLCCPHPATSRDLHLIVGPPCGGPTNAASPGTRSPFEDLSAPTAVSPPRNVPCPLPLEVCNSSGYVGM